MSKVTRTVAKTDRPYAGVLPAERRAERRSRLIESGLELFGTNGFAAATVIEICQGAGIGPKHFYEQFTAREDLLLAVFDQVVEDLERSVLGALDDAPDDVSSRVMVAIDAFLHALLDDTRRARVVCIEATGVTTELDQRRRATSHRFATLVVAEAEAAGVVRQTALTESIALALVGGANELATDWLLAPKRQRQPIPHLSHALSALFIASTTIEPVSG